MNTLLCLLVCAVSVHGAVITFSGNDSGAGPGDPTPLSDAARAAFLASLGGRTTSLLDFESIPVQYSETMDLSTFTLHLVGTSSEADGGVTAGDSTLPSASLGFNTTPGGSHFLRIVPLFDIGPAGFRIVFDRPVEFFGANFTGLGTATGDLMIELSNGASPLLTVPGDLAGGAQFFGFTTFGDPISELSVTHNVTGFTRDIYGVDDVITHVSEIPEPGAWLLMAGGLMAIGVRRWFC